MEQIIGLVFFCWLIIVCGLAWGVRNHHRNKSLNVCYLTLHQAILDDDLKALQTALWKLLDCKYLDDRQINDMFWLQRRENTEYDSPGSKSVITMHPGKVTLKNMYAAYLEQLVRSPRVPKDVKFKQVLFYLTCKIHKQLNHY